MMASPGRIGSQGEMVMFLRPSASIPPQDGYAGRQPETEEAERRLHDHQEPDVEHGDHGNDLPDGWEDVAEQPPAAARSERLGRQHVVLLALGQAPGCESTLA